MVSLLGQKALVTGGSRGLGLAIATHLSNLGASINLLARNEDLMKQNISRLNRENGQEHDYIACDLNNIDQIGDTIGKERLKNTSILINCAGVSQNSLLNSTSIDQINSIVTTNLIAPIVLSKLLIKPMLRYKPTPGSKRSPVIINVSSILSLNKFINGTTVYTSTKAGLIGFTKNLAVEMNGKIRCNSILPGLMNTDMGQNVGENLGSVEIEDVLSSIEFLISNESINGECLTIDEAYSLK